MADAVGRCVENKLPCLTESVRQGSGKIVKLHCGKVLSMRQWVCTAVRRGRSTEGDFV
jgi:hypothetical protein